MVRIRMQRFGRTHRPFFRIAAVEGREKRNGKVLENLGWYNPFEKDASAQVNLKGERIREWIGKGAQPSDSVRDMLARHDLLTDAERSAWEADRKIARDRVACKKAAERADAAVKAIEEAGGSAETDPEPFVKAAKDARSVARKTVSMGRVEAAETAAAEAEAQLAAFTKAEDEHKAKAAAEEAAAAEAAPEAEGESSGEAAAEGDEAKPDA